MLHRSPTQMLHRFYIYLIFNILHENSHALEMQGTFVRSRKETPEPRTPNPWEGLNPKPQTSKPRTSKPQTSEPQTSEPQTSKPLKHLIRYPGK